MSPIAKEWYANLDDFKILLKRLSYIMKDKKLYNLSLMGGEPLLHNDILDFCYISRQTFPDTNIKLYTNGILLKEKNKSFYKVLSDLNIQLIVSKYDKQKTFYNTNLSLSKITNNTSYLKCNNRLTDIKYVLNNVSHNLYKFFTDFPCAQLNMNGDFYSCIIPANINKINSYFNCHFKTIEHYDYINIFKIDDVQDIIDMNNKSHIPFCDYCQNKSIENWDISKCKINEWIK
jgi:uncharacterized Fe-S cluster-containing radical SAM superfamily protein